MEKLPAGINVWLEMGLHTNNTLRYVNANQLHQVLGNSLCDTLPGFTESDYTASFTCKGKIRPLKLLERSEDAKNAFSVLKRSLLSEGEVQTTLKAIEKFTCAMYGRKTFTSVDKAWLDIFFKKYRPNKNDTALKGNIRKIDSGCLPPCFRVLQKILRTTCVNDI